MSDPILMNARQALTLSHLSRALRDLATARGELSSAYGDIDYIDGDLLGRRDACRFARKRLRGAFDKAISAIPNEGDDALLHAHLEHERELVIDVDSADLCKAASAYADLAKTLLPPRVSRLQGLLEMVQKRAAEPREVQP